MNSAEVRVVKRELEGYLDQLELARLAEEKADELGKKYESMAGLRCMPLTKNDCGKNTGMKPDFTGKFLEIFDQQDELLKQAEAYRAKAGRCRRFIESIDDDRAEYLRMAYLEGQAFKNIGDQKACSTPAVCMAIDKCLEMISRSQAQIFGLL